MIILSVSSFPPESAKEIGKRFMERAPLPDYIKMRGPYILPRQEDGIKSITIYEVDRPTRIAEAFEHLSNDQARYFGVQGYSYSINVSLEAGEALKVVGLG
jgi:hypothetical protein